MKTIALAIENFSRYAGGAEAYAVSLAQKLATEGWEIHLFGKTWDGEPSQAHFHRILIPDCMPAWIQILWFAFQHRRMTRLRHFDIILGFGNTIRMNVYQSHGGVHPLSTARKAFSEPNRLLRGLKRLLIRFSPKQWARHWIESAPFRQIPKPVLVAISDMIRIDIRSFYNINDPISVVYNGVDTARFNPESCRQLRGKLRQSLGLEPEEAVFLFPSLDLRKKGILPLVEALAILKGRAFRQFRLLVAGGRPGRFLRNRIQTLGLERFVLFLGPVRNMEECYADAQVLVLPTYYDACSLVVIEAMACGLPAVTTQFNGAAGIIENGKSGFVIAHPPDAEEIADCMEQLLIPERLEAMSRTAALTGSRFSTEKNHRQMMDIFEAVISDVH